MRKTRLLAALLTFVMIFSVFAASTYAAEPAGGYPDAEDLPAIDTIPDPFKFYFIENDPNGDGIVSNVGEWEARRAELKDLMQRYWMGYKYPTASEDVWGTGNVSTDLATGVTTVSGASVTVRNPDRLTEEGTPVQESFGLWVYLPTRQQLIDNWGTADIDVPFLISHGTNGVGALNAANMNAHGYALVGFNPGNIYPDDSQAADGINRDGVYTRLYPYDPDVYEQTSGTLMALAWATSQIITAMENPVNGSAQTLGQMLGLDPTKTGVVGHSRWGKSSLFSAAFDERIDICIPSESGGSGAQSYRYKVEGKIFNFNTHFANADRIYGKTETPTVSYGQGNSWFPETAADLLNRENQFPFDSSDIIALVAPRALIATTSIHHHWLGNEGQIAAVQAAAEVYDFIGTNEIEKNNVAIRARQSDHSLYQRDVPFMMAIFDREFKQAEDDQVLHVQDLTVDPNGRNYNALCYPARDYATVADMTTHPFEVNSSYMPWSSPNKYSLWTAQENFLVGYPTTITANSNAPDVDLYMPDGTKIDAVSGEDGVFTFNVTAEQAVYGRYEFRTEGADKENRSVFFGAVSLSDALRHGTQKGDEGEENRLMGFSSRLANTADDLPLVYVTGDTEPLTMSTSPARVKPEETTKLEYGILFHDPLFTRLAGSGTWAVDDAHTFNAKNLKFVTIPGYTFEISYSDIYAGVGREGAARFTKGISWNVEQFNNGAAENGVWPPVPDTLAEKESGTADRPAGPAPKATNFDTEVTGVEAVRSADGDATDIIISFSEALRKGEFGFGLNIADMWTTTWNEEGTQVTLSVADLDLTAASLDGNLIIYRLMDLENNLIGGPIEKAFTLPFMPPAYELVVDVDKAIVNSGEYFIVDTAVNEPASTNTMIATYSYDPTRFEYRGFAAAEGVTRLKTEIDAENGTVTLMLAKIGDYGWQDIGKATFSGLADVELPMSAAEIGVNVQYVYKAEDGAKYMVTMKGSDKLITGRPWVGDPTLIDLSNAIDYFGAAEGAGNWDTAMYYDFNGNGEVDISDITYIAVRVK